MRHLRALAIIRIAVGGRTTMDAADVRHGTTAFQSKPTDTCDSIDSAGRNCNCHRERRRWSGPGPWHYSSAYTDPVTTRSSRPHRVLALIRHRKGTRMATLQVDVTSPH